MPTKKPAPPAPEVQKTKPIELWVSPTDIAQLQTVVDKTTAEFIRELPIWLKAKLEKHVASCLGFDSDGDNDEWRVGKDRYNGVAQYIYRINPRAFLLNIYRLS